jgi:hypothetical protein
MRILRIDPIPVGTVSVKTMEIIQQMPDTVEHQGGPSA